MEKNATQQQEQHVEQITKTPASETSAPSSKPRQKDPKKVAAGKALARKNREARQAAARLKESEESSSKDLQAFSLSYDNILKASALVGAGFTLYHGWSAVSGELKKRFESEAPNSPPAEIEEPVEITPHTPKPDSKPKGIEME